MKELVGVGLRHENFPEIEELSQTPVQWFEIISENFMNTKGRPFEILEKVLKDFPVAMHGVSMSIGSSRPINTEYLKKLKELIHIVDPIVVSDHLCWTGLKDNNLHNLLPLPYNDQTLDFLCTKIQNVQEYLGREIAIENLSAYFSLKSSTYTEWDFLRKLSQKSGCKILLDINNIYVNSVNQGFDPYKYLDSIPNDKVAEIHLAGFSDMGNFLFDTHSRPVHNDVWDLYRYKIKNLPTTPVLIEWDEDIPAFSKLEQEAEIAQKIWREEHE